MNGPGRVIDFPLHVRLKAHAAEQRAFVHAFEQAAQTAISATFKRKLPVPVSSRWIEPARLPASDTDALLEP